MSLPRPHTARRVSFHATHVSEAPSPPRQDDEDHSPVAHRVPARASFSGLLSHVHNLPPRQVWHTLKDSVVCRPIDLRRIAVQVPSMPKKSADVVRVVVIADTRGFHHQLDPMPAGDILIHAGNFTSKGTVEEIDNFCSWLAQQKQYASKVVVAGSNEVALDPQTCQDVGVEAADITSIERKLSSVCFYTKHALVETCGLRIFASPHLTGTEGMAFTLNRRDEAHERWAEAQKAVPLDILISHGPPLGHLDFVAGLGATGCADLLDFIEAFRPSYHFFGHVPPCRGVTTNNTTLFVNACNAIEPLEDDTSEKVPLQLSPPIVIDVPLRGTEEHAAFLERLRSLPSADTMPGHISLSSSVNMAPC